MLGTSNCPPPAHSLADIEKLGAGKQDDHEQQKDNRYFLTKCFKWVVKHPIKATVIAGSAVAIASGGGFYYLVPIVTALSNRSVAPSNYTPLTQDPQASMVMGKDDSALGKDDSGLGKFGYAFCDRRTILELGRPIDNEQDADLKCCETEIKTRRWSLIKKNNAAQSRNPCSNYDFKGSASGCGFETSIRYAKNGWVSDRETMNKYCFDE